MLSVRDALDRALATVSEPRPETIPLEHAHERVVAEVVTAPSALPPWSNSAMDGFALIASDTKTAPLRMEGDACAAPAETSGTGPWLTVAGTIQAGAVCNDTLLAGHAYKIMTGAPIPDGANAVVMREHTTERDGQVCIHQRAVEGQNVRLKGENLSTGAVVARPGDTIDAPLAGLLAAVGKSHITVSAQPRVGIVATGNEIIPAGTPLGPGQIYSSNSTAIAAWVRQAGGTPVDCGIARDTIESTRSAFERAAQCDVIVSTGGVSVGDFDVVKDAMYDLGASMEFWKIRMKPGKPLALGRLGSVPIFGLPGNPVSAQIGFLQFVRPWIKRSLGASDAFLPVVDARVMFDFAKKAGRVEFARVRLHWGTEGWEAHPTGLQGSGNQVSMVNANGLAMLDERPCALRPGDPIRVQMLPGAFQASSTPDYPW